MLGKKEEVVNCSEITFRSGRPLINLTGKNGETESRTPFIKSLLGASVSPGAESDFWPTMPSREFCFFCFFVFK